MAQERIKKIIKITIIAFIILGGIEIALRATGFVIKKVSENAQIEKQIEKQKEEEAQYEAKIKKEKQEEKKYFTIPIYDTTISIKMNEFLDLLNKRNFQEAYDMLEPDFRELYYKNPSDFQVYAQKNYIGNSGKTAELISFTNVGVNTYNCVFRFMEIKPDTEIPVYQESITMRFLDEKKALLGMRGYILSFEPKADTKVGNCTISVKKVSKFTDKVVAEIEVNNQETDSTIISDSNVGDIKLEAIKRDKTKIYTDMILSTEDPIDFEVPSQETIQFTLEYVLRKKSDEISGISFKNITVGEEKKTAYIKIKEP